MGKVPAPQTDAVRRPGIDLGDRNATPKTDRANPPDRPAGTVGNLRPCPPASEALTSENAT
ncbi:hypothetical protein [Oxynema sp. CENA135]|uniref:hypothetical protein n=1 Tax=Oxynema sp. CENA135 TaxID=984206 RepID=UPI001F2BDE97|nr:hypothetical protein [Oxynema sp. CENA135]